MSLFQVKVVKEFVPHDKGIEPFLHEIIGIGVSEKDAIFDANNTFELLRSTWHGVFNDKTTENLPPS